MSVNQKYAFDSDTNVLLVNTVYMFENDIAHQSKKYPALATDTNPKCVWGNNMSIHTYQYFMHKWFLVPMTLAQTNFYMYPLFNIFHINDAIELI